MGNRGAELVGVLLGRVATRQEKKNPRGNTPGRHNLNGLGFRVSQPNFKKIATTKLLCSLWAVRQGRDLEPRLCSLVWGILGGSICAIQKEIEFRGQGRLKFLLFIWVVLAGFSTFSTKLRPGVGCALRETSSCDKGTAQKMSLHCGLGHAFGVIMRRCFEGTCCPLKINIPGAILVSGLQEH